jgi:hypothetical protein
MTSVRHRMLALALAAALLWVGAILAAQMAGHLAHHGHHQSAAHATVLCSWMCAAGQGVETAAVLFEGFEAAVPALVTSNTPVPAAPALILPSRAPPVRV